MLRKAFLFVVALALLGCISGTGFDPVAAAKASGQMQQFLQEHPDAKIVVVLLDEAKAKEKLTQYAECGAVSAQTAYMVTFDDVQTKGVAFVDEKSQKLICVVIRQGSLTPTPPATAGARPTGGTASADSASKTQRVGNVALSEYRDEKNGYRILKPASWTAEVIDGYVKVKDGNTDALVWPLQLSGENRKATGVDVGNYLIGVLKKKMPDFRIESIHQAPDKSVMQVTAAYADPAGSGVQLKGVLSSFADGSGNSLVAGYEAPAAVFDEKEPLLRKIVASYASLKREKPTGRFPGLKLVQGGDADVSMLIPEGWTFYGGSSCTTKFVQAVDLDHQARRVFVYGGLGPIYFDAAAKQRAVEYCNGLRAIYGPTHPCSLVPGQPPMHDLPLAASVTKEAFLNALPEYFQTEMIRSILPGAEPFDLEVVSTERVGSDEVFDVRFDFNGIPAVAKMTMGPLMPDAVTGTMYGYSIVGLTAESKEELAALYPTLIQSVESLTLSQPFISSCQELQNAQAKAYAQISKTLSETSDVVIKGYEGRQQQLDVVSEKGSDARLGVERVYNPDNDEVYEVPNGFYQAYDSNRELFQKSNLQQLTPEQYTTYAPLNGALHIG